MKKLLLSLFTLCAACLTASAQTVDVSKVTGTYTCDLYISLGEPISSDAEAMPNMSVKLEKGTKDGAVNFAIYNLDLGEGIGSLGDIILPNVEIVDAGDGKYTFAKYTPVRLNLNVAGSTVDADVTINNETSYIDNGKLYADVDIAWIGGVDGNTDMPIYVRAIGPRTSQPADVSKVTGTYDSDLYISISEPIPSDAEAMPNMSVKLEKGTKDGAVNFAIYDLDLGEGIGNLGDIVLPNVEIVDAGNGKYTFAKYTPVRLNLNVAGSTVDADVTINSETSYIDNGKLYADVDIAWIGGFDGTNDVPIYVRAIGTKSSSDGISGVKATAKVGADAVYNLNGVRVSQPGKGVYIIGGKKVIR